MNYRLKKVPYGACLRENEHLFRCRAELEGNILSCARARAHSGVLLTQKSCAVGMRNAILGNHLKISAHRKMYRHTKTIFKKSEKV